MSLTSEQHRYFKECKYCALCHGHGDEPYMVLQPYGHGIYLCSRHERMREISFHVNGRKKSLDEERLFDLFLVEMLEELIADVKRWGSEYMTPLRKTGMSNKCYGRYCKEVPS